MICGLLGRKLSHSYSPAIHGQLGDYPYSLFEVEPEQLERFLKTGNFTGLNVTIPYKTAVIPYLDAMSDTARRLGAVNTLVRQPNGTLMGDNTDYFGFAYSVNKSGITVFGKKALVLGSGGAGKTVKAVLEDMGAQVTLIARGGPDHYGNFEKHRDASLLVNATPVGMYPDTGLSLVDLRCFPRLEGVFDLIYNPFRTALLLQAEQLGIPARSGLEMLVAQAWKASSLFTGEMIPQERISQVYEMIRREMENIILIGMPGCGKSTVGKLLAQKTGRRFVDTDFLIEEQAKMSIPEIFEKHGQAHFRALETRVLQEAGKKSGLVIACGGGVVTREENYTLLRQNGVIVWLHRELACLPTQGRPLSQGADLKKMYNIRRPMYEHFADLTVRNDRTPEETVQRITEVLSL